MTGMFAKLQLSDSTVASVEWEITPDLAFCTFSAKGLRDELVSTGERVCYFFIDNWGDEPKLYLMERGVRHVNILAEVKAPPAMIDDCITSHGRKPLARGNFPVDASLKAWLLSEVVTPQDSPYLIPTVAALEVAEDMGDALPLFGETAYSGPKVNLPAEASVFSDDQVALLVRQWNFSDKDLNPQQGGFANALADTGDGLTVVDERTGLLWQRYGLDLCSVNRMKKNIEQLKSEGFAGHHDWRLPTLEEALSLMEATPNAKGIYLHPCFSKEQPFIFVAARRKPTGYWFVDYAKGRTYWSSGTVPGGFCRLCRRLE
ncbi:MAG: DUF1566 domain-containing protein [Desulfobulbaceae bacterium]|nr:DUF1566 domain-containing protein [Desulfobulbaceae bacterium]